MRNKYIDLIALTILKLVILISVFSSSSALIIFSFSPTVAWGAIPNPPANLTATVISSSRIDLTWTDNSIDESGFSIERKTGASGVYKVIANVGPNVTTYSSGNLIQTTEYYYRVRARSRSQYSAYSDEVTATTLPLNPPSGLTATVISLSRIDLTWTDNSIDESGFSIERKTGASGAYKVIANVGPNVTTYSSGNLIQTTEYYYRLRAKSRSQYSAYSDEVTATTLPLNPPSGLTATVISLSRIDLTWTDNSIDESGFSIERKTDPSGTYAVIGSVGPNVTTYSNENLIQAITYYYRVRAISGSTYSAYTSVVDQTIQTIAASAGPNGAISPSGIVGVANGTTQVFTMTPNNGYKIATVTVDGGAVATNPTYTFSNITANHTIAVTFEVNTFIITASDDANGSISPTGSVAVNGGANQTFTITPNTGYHVSDVFVDGVSVGAVPSYSFTNVTAPHTIAASFAINIYAITATADANGSISPNGIVTVNSGATTTFTITPNTEYHIADVQVDGASVGAVTSYTFTNATSNHTIAATFAINTYAVTATADANGSISPNGIVSVNSGTTTTFTITPNTGYHVSDVLVDGASVGAVSTYQLTNVTATHTITASFAIDTYTITASANAHGTISPMGAVNVFSGATQTFTMTPNTGYYLSNLSVDGSSVATAGTYTFTNVTANHTIAATFSAVTYTITASTGANGTISPMGAVSIISGATQTFTMTPAAGYRVFDVRVDGSSVGAVSSYVFNNVISNHTVAAIFSAASTTISGGIISTNTTWTLAGSPYIVTGNVSVYGAGAPTLTIEPGVVVKFNNNMQLTIGNSSPGALYAVGTPSAPIIFTSNDPSPAPGKWFGISFYSGTMAANSVLDYVTVEYGGGNGNGNIYFQYTSPVIIKNSTIRKSSNRGIYAIGSALVIQNNTITSNNTVGIEGANYSAFTATGNTITNNGSYGINSNSGPSSITGNVITNNANHGINVNSGSPSITGNVITNNTGYGVYDPTGAAIISSNTFTGNSSYPVRMGINQVGNVNTFGTNGINAIEVLGGTVSQNLTMRNIGIPYIVRGDVTVYGAGAPTLTIEPGVVVKFSQYTTLYIGYSWMSGALSAVGTAAAPITLTSNQTTPTPGYWGGIFFYDGTVDASTELSYVTVEYGGYGNNSNLNMNSASPTIRNSTIRKSSGYGIYLVNGGSVIQNSVITDNATSGIYNAGGSPFTTTGNTITSNGAYGINDSTGSAAVISGNTISANGSYPARMGINQVGNVNTYGTNGINAIEVIGGTVGQNLTMKNNGVPYAIANDITVGSSSNPMLTIEAGVTAKFNNGTGLNIANGTNIPGALYAVGTATAPIIFTSNDPAPAPGKWKGINFNYGTVSANTVLAYATVEYGGQGGAYSNANLALNYTSPIIMNCVIRKSAGSGVYLTSASNSPVIVNSDITANKWGVYASSSNPYVMYNNIHANTTAGVWNATTSPDVDARNNWWGVATGPTYTAGNAGGSGDSISDHVLYNPWLGQPTGSNLRITEARAMPTALNPNGGHVTFTASLSSSATWTITISDGSSNIVNTFTGAGTTIKQKWYGDDSQTIKVADGPYYYRIDAQDPASGASASSPEGLLMVSSQVPIVYMDPPIDNQMFTGGTTINITGTVSDTDFKNYTLDYGVGGNPVSWTTLKSATTPVTDGLIYSWNTSALTGFVYTLRLTVNDNAGNIVVDTARVRFLRIQNVAVSQNYLSPNGDGLQDATSLSATFSYPSDWTITLSDSSSAPVKTYSGTATSLSRNWNGTNDAGAIVADGIYTYQITAVSSETGIQATPKTGSIIVDTTPPTALISAPGSNSVLWNTVLITGSASDVNINTYKVEYGPASGSGPWTLINSGTSSITNNTLGTWITNDPSLPVPIQNGSYIIRLTVTDKAGNTSASSVPVILNDLRITNVGASSNSIDTSALQTSSIFFTVNAPATVILKMIPEKLGPNGTTVYQSSQVCAAAGAYSFVWNGHDNTGKAVPDEAYIYILEATDGIKTTSYNPPAPTGMGTVTCSHSGFDPAKNLPMTITYTPTQPSRVNVGINWSTLRFTVLAAYPATAGGHTTDWDGRSPGNTLLDTTASSYCAIASLLPVNIIITAGDTVKVTDLKTDPYALQISYGQFTRIKYTLSREANVTVKLTSPSGSIRTLVSDLFQAAGPQALDEWSGLDVTDPTGMKTLITEEGNYMVSVQAVNPATGTSSTTRANIRIGY